MFNRYFFATLIFVVMFGCAEQASAQFGYDPFNDRDEAKRQEALRIKEMLSKQQADHDKKEHEELLKNGEQALQLSSELEKAIEATPTLTAEDKKKLEALEKLATKIRNELGGGDDPEVDKEVAEKTSSLSEGFRFLQSTTAQLFGELKKTTRFSISAAAIETSNTVIRLARLLRLRK